MAAADEWSFIEQVERADTEQLARLLAHPTAHEEEVLAAYLGEARYERMHERALQRNLRRAAEEPKGNVVVIHGIMGGELSTRDQGQGTTAIWARALRLLGGGMRRLELDDKGVGAAHSGDELESSAILKRYYGELILSLSERWRTRAFHYDWRKPLTTAAQDLAAAVAHWFPGEPVHFVAHSLGGLVARAFIADDPQRWATMEKGLEDGSGGRLIMLGTPNHGSYDIPRVLTGLDALVHRLALLDVGLSLTGLVRILGTFPAPYQMLPSPFADPRADALYKSATWAPLGVSQRHLDAARAQHERLRPVVDPDRMVYVAGGNVPTFVSVIPDLVGKPEGYGMARSGDGRVAHTMGELVDPDRRKVPMYFADASHGGLTSDRRVLAALEDLLADGKTDLLPTRFGEARGEEDPEALAREARESDEASEQELRALLRQIATRERALAAPRRGADAVAPADGTVAQVPPAPVPVSEQERRVEDNLLRDLLGADDASGPSAPPPASRAGLPEVAVGLWHGNIAEVHRHVAGGDPVDVIAVGHYTGVKPQQAEKHLDDAITRALGGVRPGSPVGEGGIITQLTLRGTIGGGLGQPFFLDDPRDTRKRGARARLICLAGLGLPGRFGAGELVVVVRELCWAAGRLDRHHLASVLIGAGAGNLTEARAAKSWLRGIAQALAGQGDHGPRVRRVTLVEWDPQRVLNLDEALVALAPRVESEGLVKIVYKPLSDAAKRGLREAVSAKPADAPQTPSDEGPLPTRITLSRDGKKFRFGAITATAAVPEREIPLDPALVAQANDELAAERDTVRRRDRGEFLGRLLWPVDLRDQLTDDAPVVMILDSTTARIHWELVARWQSDGAVPGEAAEAAANPDRDYLGIACGFTRQLRTAFAPPPEPPPPPERLLRVLVVADPAEDAHLPGAEEEGIAVADLFERLNRPGSPVAVDVVRLMGPRKATRTEVLRHLIMQRFHVLHFAGHCYYDEKDPSASGWIFTGGATLSASELNRIDRVPEFVFSNACESGITPDRAGNRSAGLAPSFAESFFARGVGNFVCTAWPVNDAAARTFATSLYERLLGLQDREAGPLPMHLAMRAARAEVAKTVDGERSWGAYQHYGDPLYRLISPTAAGAVANGPPLT